MDCGGDEDLVDHDELRHDAVLAGLGGKLSDCGALAGKSTLNPLEHAPSGDPTRHHKIGHDGVAIERLFVEAHGAAPQQIILDLDATDDAIHGEQERRFFHGYYGGVHSGTPKFAGGVKRENFRR